MRSRIAFILCTVLVLGTLGVAPRAVAATCVASEFQACSVDEFMAKAKAMREKTDVRPLTATDRVVARYAARADADAAAKRHGARVLQRIDGRGTVSLSIPSGKSAAAFIKELRAEKKARYVEPATRVRALGQVVDWGAEAIKAPEAETSNGATGSGVIVAVVDTGVDYNHEDLAGNIWTNAGEIPGNDADDDGNGYKDDVHGWDFAGNFFTSSDPDNDPMDDAGHGTHVAGIIAAADNSVGVRGVAPDATIMPVKVLDSIGAGWDSTIALGIRYAVDNGADIINMSLGGYNFWPSGALKDAVDYAAANDVAVVAAAGNAFFYSLPSYPAAYPSVISVSAARESDLTKTWWSDWGHADFLAPGDSVLSSTPGNSYSRFSGTSMAAPHVAGALALIKGEHPGFDPTQLEQALASTATDSYFQGTDEVSGAGFPDVEAATGTLPAAQVELNRAPYLIPADGTTASTITLRILDASGAPVVGETGTWSTDKGSLSDYTFLTDSFGEATTDLTADDVYGSATVTATPVSYDPATVRVIVEDDRVRIDDITVAHQVADTGRGEGEATPAPEEGAGGTVNEPLMPGDDVVVTGWLGQHRFDFETARAQFSFTVTGPDGPVPELSDDLETASTFGFGSQISVASMPMTIPLDATEGTYTVEGTLTTIKPEGDETHTFSESFTVGDAPSEVLVVAPALQFDEETFNFFWPHQNDSVVRRAIQDLGRTVSAWNVDVQGSPPVEELVQHSTVVWLGGWEGSLPMDTITSYLQSGGNLVLSGEQFGTFARAAGSADYRDFLHSIGLLAEFFPDDNHQIYPASVGGTAGGMFDGVTLDVNAYDLNHTGESTALFTEELKLNTADGATSLFEYPAGVYAPAVAGVTVDTGTYRVVNLGFGLESINDGTTTLNDVLDPLLSSFSPAPDISSVYPSHVTNSGYGSFVLTGDGFQPTGVTKIRLGSTELDDVFVLDRGTIEGFVPRAFPVGTYDVTVENPDGTTDTKSDALTVVYPAPRVASVTPTFASNDKWRTLRIDGSYFRAGAKVRLQGVLIPTTSVTSSRIYAAIPKGFTPLGFDDVKVTNTDGKSSTKNDALLVRYGFTFDMGFGADNAAVTHLQRRLKAYGFFPADQELTTLFGPITRDALKKYQKSRGLEQTGFLGYATRKKLNDTR